MSDVPIEEPAADGSGQDLVEFIQRLGKQGKLVANTAGAYAAACQKVLEIDDDWRSKDVRSLDVEEQITRFVNLRHKSYTAASLNTYKTRFSKSVEMYLSYLDDPMGFRPPKSERVSGKKKADSNTVNNGGGKGPSEDHSGERTKVDPPTSGLVKFVYPLRPNMLVQLYLPADMSTVETKRLAAFVGTLATDEQLALPAPLN